MELTQPIRNAKDVYNFLNYFKTQGHKRNYLLATLGVHTGLRISDILHLKCDQLYNFNNGTIRKTITITEQKSRKSKTIALNKTIISALKAYFSEAKPGNSLILNPQTGKSIGRVQAYRIISEAAKAVGIAYNVSCHSLRKTFGYHAWKGGVSPAVIMHIYNHSSMTTTQRYLGVAQDDLNAVYMQLCFSKPQRM